MRVKRAVRQPGIAHHRNNRRAVKTFLADPARRGVQDLVQ